MAKVPNLRRLRHRASKSLLRKPLIWLRHRGLDPADVFLASYPRSGNTWLRFQLVEILAGRSAEFDNVNRLIPEMGIHGKTPALLPGGGRLIKTHEPYRPNYTRAVYVYRDLRDILLSMYSRETELNLIHIDLDTFLKEFLEGTASGFGAWHDHIESWLGCPLARRGDLCVIRFEEMRNNPESALAEILDFLGKKVDRSVIQAAIANNSLERMKEKEKRSENLPKSKTEEGRFVRKGAVGGWRSRLTEEQIRLVDQHAGPVLARLGYPTAHATLEPVLAVPGAIRA
ncbi:MAG: sulfotransferase domain-containing protein [Acidobacteriia bacterium]|nr:sulfotransferase domain-containing protein [Terriglobia bacterium]